jgi:hypothetical protein
MHTDDGRNFDDHIQVPPVRYLMIAYRQQTVDSYAGWQQGEYGAE